MQPKIMKHKITLEFGKENCSFAYGKFCRMFRTRNFGQIGYCSLYGVDLNISDEYTKRCEECKAEFCK